MLSYKSGSGTNSSTPNTQGTVALVAAHGVAASAQWIANWAVTVSFPTLSDGDLSGAYVIYSAFALHSIVFIVKWMPETKGKALEEMG